MPHTGGQPEVVRRRSGGELVLGLVDGEGAADRDRGAAGRRERLDGGPDLGGIEPARGVEERVLGVERVSGSERDRADLRPLAGGAEIRLGTDPEHADSSDVSLEQGVHRLGGREGDERDAAAFVPELGQERAQGGRDALGDAAGRVVRGGDGRVGEEAERAGLDRHRLREGPADVDADPDRRAHARSAAAVRRRRGAIPKTQPAPSR